MNFEVLFQGDLTEDGRLRRDFRVFLATRAGSQPVDRDLGIDWSCLDGLPEAAEIMFRMELETKVEKYFPELEIVRTEFVREPGGVKPRIFCRRKEGTDRGRD